MAACWKCRGALDGTWQRHCTACGARVCWNCGREPTDTARRFCTGCGANLTAPAQSERPTPRTPLVSAPVLLLAALATAVTVVLVLTLSGDRSGPSATPSAPAVTVVEALGARTPTVSTTTVPPTTVAAPVSASAAVVYAYFDAINRRDYPQAWALGGRFLDSSYDDFVAGLATTDHDAVTVTSEDGETVHIRLSARQFDGAYRTFAGYYVVRDGAIVAASIRVA